MNSFLTLFDVIVVLARRRFRMAERALAPLGLNHTEARLLTLLREKGGAAPQDALASQLTVDRSNAGRALKRLERDGYIVRRKDAADKRAYVVEMAEKGGAAVAGIARLKVDMAERFFADLTEDEARAVLALLRKALTDEEIAITAA